MSADRTAEIRARLDAATSGPWELWADDDDVIGKVVCRSYPHEWPIIRTPLAEPSRAGIDTPDEFADAELIAHAPEDLAWCLAKIAEAADIVEGITRRGDSWSRARAFLEEVSE